MNQLVNKPNLGDIDKLTRNMLDDIDLHYDKVFNQDLIINKIKT